MQRIMTFGQLVKAMRIEKRLTLRQCCLKLGFDPSNWSKMERGVTPPPKDVGLLGEWASFFGLAGDKKQEFFDVAALARNELPPDIASDKRVLAALPVFLRAARDAQLDGEKLTELIEDIRAIHSPSRVRS
jgi:transcriptional regulator with XRE-family HTH domain